VSQAAVERVVNPKRRARMAAQSLDWWYRARRVPCSGGCGRLVWQQSGRSGYCIECLSAQKTADDVRAGELRCSKCREWKPDAEFPSYRPVKSRRGRNAQCRVCATKVRRDFRRKRPDSVAAENRRRIDKYRRENPMSSLYIVLQPNGDHSYHEVARVVAASPAHAIEQAATASGDYIAVTEGRFKVMSVAPVQAFRVVKVNAEDVA
jgi:hypothetical protein